MQQRIDGGVFFLNLAPFGVSITNNNPSDRFNTIPSCFLENVLVQLMLPCFDMIVE